MYGCCSGVGRPAVEDILRRRTSASGTNLYRQDMHARRRCIVGPNIRVTYCLSMFCHTASDGGDAAYHDGAERPENLV